MHALVAVLSLALLVAACGDDAPRDDGSGGESMGGAGGSGGSGVGGSGVGGGASNVACGPTLTCTAPDGCCVNSGQGTSSCEPEGMCVGIPIRCDGPEDCGGNACCGNFTQGFSCTAETACATGSQRCQQSDDCPPDAPTCVPATFGEIPANSCGTP